jgi:hypothetical protein
MKLRIINNENFLDIELKEKIDINILMDAMNDMSIMLLETKAGTKMYINPVNVLAIEVIDTPPIEQG